VQGVLPSGNVHYIELSKQSYQKQMRVMASLLMYANEHKLISREGD